MGYTDSLLFQHKKSLQVDLKEELMMISLNQENRMWLTACPSSIISAVEEMISQHWEGGIQHSKEKAGFWEFKLAGYPWWADGEETVKSRYLIANIIMKLKSLGWEVATTLDVSRKLNDKAVFVFRQCPPQTQPFAVLSFHQKDKIRFLASSHDGKVLEDGIDRILSSVSISVNTSLSQDWQARQWQFRGAPFNRRAWPRVGKKLRMIIYHLTLVMELFQQQGWTVVASADVSTNEEVHRRRGRHNPQDFPLNAYYSWFLLYDPNTRTSTQGSQAELTWGSAF